MTRPSKLTKKLNKSNDGLSNNQKRQEIKDIVVRIAKAHNELASIVDKKTQDINDRLDDNSIVMQAIAQILGVEKVAETAKTVRIKIVEDEARQQGENVAKGFAEGKLAKVDKVSENTLVVTTVKKPDGTVMYPTKSYLPFGFYKPEVQAVLRDKKVGDVMQLPTDSGNIEILDIYIEVQKSEEATGCADCPTGHKGDEGVPGIQETEPKSTIDSMASTLPEGVVA